MSSPYSRQGDGRVQATDPSAPNMNNEISQSEKDFIHGQSVEAARAFLEWRMELAELPEPNREKLRDAFQGTTNTSGMRAAVNVEKRSCKQ